MGTSQKKLSEIYKKIKGNKYCGGKFYKTCFHLHTPESYDYRLFQDWDSNQYLAVSEEEIFNICKDEKVIPPNFSLNDINLDGTLSVFSNKKELFSFLLLANSLIANNFEIILVSDHNTIDGVDKLIQAINVVKDIRHPTVYPEVFLGVEISCADKCHVVGIFENNIDNKSAIRKWLNENLFNIEQGSFKTSLDVLQFIYSLNGIGYIAHINSSNIFDKNFLSNAYKNNLLKQVDIIGLSDISQKDNIDKKLYNFKRGNKVKYILDNDSHDIDNIINNAFWIKANKRSFAMLKQSFQDYDVSIVLKKKSSTNQFIKGLYIENNRLGFLCDKDIESDFCITFSDALTCLIGGRGTGKSTVLEMLEYSLGQYCSTQNILNFVCTHGNTWLLYCFRNEEYLIEIVMPVKDHMDDNILMYFGQNLSRRFHFDYCYNKNAIKQFALKNYIKLYKVENNLGTLQFNNVKDKKDLLNSFFDTKYSVNTLVNIAGGPEINKFISDMLLRNKTLANPDTAIHFRNLKELPSVLNNLKEQIKLRDGDIAIILDDFNKTQEGKLKICFSRNLLVDIPDFEKILFDSTFSPKKFSYGYNISDEDLIEFLFVLFENMGPLKFFTLLATKDINEVEKHVQIKDFCTAMTQKMIEDGIVQLKKENIPKFIATILKDLSLKYKAAEIKTFLKNSIYHSENLTLEFNINNKEGGSQKTLFKPISELSLGQKVVAMLSFVLGYSEYSNDFGPLIIDQPEDNLDNQYIFKNLVNQLRNIKEKRQVIIATHNSTIVTNAKADLVCVMESNGDNGWIKAAGYAGDPSIKKYILQYLEGGKDSFIHKRNVYEDVL